MPKQLQYDPDNIDDAEVVDAINGQFEDVSGLQRDIDSQMDALFQEFGGDDRDTEFKINVKRAMAGKGELEHCFSATPSELPIIDRIKNEYGPGTYQIWIYKDGKIFKRRNLHIAKPLEKPKEPRENHGGDMTELVRAMMEAQQKRDEQMRELIFSMQRQHNPAPASDPMQMMGSMMGVMMQMKDFIGSDKKSGLSEFIEVAKAVKEISGDESDPSLTGGLMNLAREFGPKLLEMGQQTAGQQFSQYRQNPINSQQPQQPHQPQSHQQPPAAPTQEQHAMIAQQLEFLVARAKEGADVTLYADLILDNVPDSILQGYVQRSDIVEQFSAAHPGVAQHRAWFDRLIGEIRAAYDTGDDGANNESLTNPGDSAQTSEGLSESGNDAPTQTDKRVS